MRNLALKEGLKCSFCGEKIESDIFNTIDGEVCESCYNNEYVECYECGVAYNLNEVVYLSDGSAVCQECYNTEYVECYDCGKVIHTEQSILIDNYYTICENCYTNHYVVCHYCDSVIHEDAAYTTYDDFTLCHECYQEQTITCNGCGRVLYSDFEEIGDYFYCYDCYESGEYYDLEDSILPYNYKKKQNELTFHKAKNESPVYLGVEYEMIVDISHNPIEVLEVIRDEGIGSNIVIFKEDGSLGAFGIEAVFDPITDKFLKEINFNHILNKLSSILDRRAMSSRAGIHIHISKDYLNKNDVLKLSNLLYHLEEYITDFINRTEKQKQEWCEFPDYLFKCYDDVMDNYISRKRYIAVNNTKNTIEIRIFGATKEFKDLINYMKFVKYCCFYIKNISNNFLINNKSNIVFSDFLSFIKKYDIKFYELLRKSKPVKVYTGKFGLYLNNTCDSDTYNNNYSTIAVEDEFLNNYDAPSYSIEYEEAREEL